MAHELGEEGEEVAERFARSRSSHAEVVPRDDHLASCDDRLRAAEDTGECHALDRGGSSESALEEGFEEGWRETECLEGSSSGKTFGRLEILAALDDGVALGEVASAGEGGNRVEYGVLLGIGEDFGRAEGRVAGRDFGGGGGTALGESWREEGRGDVDIRVGIHLGGAGERIRVSSSWVRFCGLLQ